MGRRLIDGCAGRHQTELRRPRHLAGASSPSSACNGSDRRRSSSPTRTRPAGSPTSCSTATTRPHLEVVEEGRPVELRRRRRICSGSSRRRIAFVSRICSTRCSPFIRRSSSRCRTRSRPSTKAMLPRQPLRFLLADDPGAGKTIMAGLLIKELIARGDLAALSRRLPRQPRRAVAGRALPALSICRSKS